MFKIYKTIWINSKPVLQYVAGFAVESEAKAKALKIKGLVKRDDKIWYDFRR